MSEACDLVSPSLTLTEVLWEKTTDTKLLLGWNATTIVLAFRGTASMSNVVADLQVAALYKTASLVLLYPSLDLIAA